MVADGDSGPNCTLSVHLDWASRTQDHLAGSPRTEVGISPHCSGETQFAARPTRVRCWLRQTPEERSASVRKGSQLHELARHLDNGRVHDRDLTELAAALHAVLDAYSRRPFVRDR